MTYKEKVKLRLEHIKNGTLQGVEVRAVIEYVDKHIGAVEYFEVSSLNNAEEDICEMIEEINDSIINERQHGIYETGSLRKLIKVIG